jgi:hypothetical protein
MERVSSCCTTYFLTSVTQRGVSVRGHTVGLAGIIGAIGICRHIEEVLFQQVKCASCVVENFLCSRQQGLALLASQTTSSTLPARQRS